MICSTEGCDEHATCYVSSLEDVALVVCDGCGYDAAVLGWTVKDFGVMDQGYAA